MNQIVLTTKDADKILSYLREQLNSENNDYEEYQNDKAEIIKKYTETPLIKMFINKQEIDDACKEAEEIHKNTIKRLLGFIELLTTGSEEII